MTVAGVEVCPHCRSPWLRRHCKNRQCRWFFCNRCHTYGDTRHHVAPG